MVTTYIRESVYRGVSYGSVQDKLTYYPAFQDNEGDLIVLLNKPCNKPGIATDIMYQWLVKYFR